MIRRHKVWLLASALGLTTITSGGACMSGWTAMGARATGSRQERIEAARRWQEGRFRDTLPREEPPTLPMLKAWMTDRSPHSVPEAQLPVMTRTAEDFAAPPEHGLRVTWLGHSTSLIEIDGQRVLLDPVWGPRASPFSWAGPARFHAPPLALDALPPLDAILISHDHYDHLDHPTITALAKTHVPFIVPLGVGAHLEHWGVAPGRITELEWWEFHEIGALKVVATPARHFSGRSLAMRDKDKTLWAGWAMIGPEHRVYFTGDTGMFPGLSEIGARLGPFDVTLIESGAYNALWADMHLGPEQAVEAHRMVRGEIMLPVHWGTFDLGLHGWTEPIERVLAAAEPLGVRVATPRIGESVEPHRLDQLKPWWPEVPWVPGAEAPIISSGLEPTTARLKLTAAVEPG